jgi:glutathione S-transferase
MKLYHFPASPNSRRVLATAFHLGINLDLEYVDLTIGAQMKSGYIKINPNHMIPTLIDDDFVLWESTAIMQYLADIKTGNEIYPGDHRRRADINRWLAWNIAHWGTACGFFIFERLVKKLLNLGEPDPVEIAKGEERFHRFAKVLNEHLTDRNWLVGNNVSLADYAVGSYLDLAGSAGYPMENYREIARWYGNVEKLDAWKKSTPANFMKQA